MTYAVGSSVNETQFIIDAHVTASDEQGSPITPTVDLSGVNFNEIGTYTVQAIATSKTGKTAQLPITVRIVKVPESLTGTKVTNTMSEYSSHRANNGLDAYLKETAAVKYGNTAVEPTNPNLTISNLEELEAIGSPGDYKINFAYKNEDGLVVTADVDLTVTADSFSTKRSNAQKR